MEADFSSFFKYCSDNEAVIKGLFQDNKIRFTQPYALNDPLEFNPTLKFSDENAHSVFELDGILLPSIEMFYRVQVIESQINAFGILSLTKNPFSFEMWARYANGHKGFMLELEPGFYKHTCMKSKNGHEYSVKQVEYVDEYILDIEKLVDKTGSIPFEVLQNEFFYKKTSRWKDENEYRMIRAFQDLPSYTQKSNYSHRDDGIYLFDFSLECVRSVIFGANMSSENKKTIVDSCKGYPIDFYQAFIVRDQIDEFDKKPSRILMISVEELGSTDELFRQGTPNFITDTDRINKRRQFKIKKLSDLPYFSDYADIVTKFYNDLLEEQKRNIN